MFILLSLVGCFFCFYIFFGCFFLYIFSLVVVMDFFDVIVLAVADGSFFWSVAVACLYFFHIFFGWLLWWLVSW